ncbi:hypothetical protein LINPERHAP1_LOCUS7531 [Linum perenne]
MAEVTRWGQPSSIRNVFVNLLLYCQVSNPSELFHRWWETMSDDFAYRFRQLATIPNADPPSRLLWNQVLESLQNILRSHSTSLENFHLPSPDPGFHDLAAKNLISHHSRYNCQHEAATAQRLRETLNERQEIAYKEIMTSIDNNDGKLFFLYGHGGIGKTYLYKCIISEIRSRGRIALVVASSSIATTLLPDASTTHSLFKIPLEVYQKGTQQVELLKAATLIIWDEAPMIHRLSFEAVDRTMCDLMDTPLSWSDYKPYGGKTVLFGGDFRQTLPVVIEL